MDKSREGLKEKTNSQQLLTWLKQLSPCHRYQELNVSHDFVDKRPDQAYPERKSRILMYSSDIQEIEEGSILEHSLHRILAAAPGRGSELSGLTVPAFISPTTSSRPEQNEAIDFY
ncbi:hypothetical protein RRG08_031806 [Elysia crispata]|uniref:Uncharacterized protein n=1 Tax=Elysia crispata TaxID=231223 RepID=A0AAE0Y629_9GAST|nr:hypothetical protein RRG08_031806 [Elysia crispata]